MRVSRLRAPNIVPLEIWDLELGTGILHDEPRRLVEGLELLRRGQGRTRWSRSPLERCMGFDSVFLGGGRAAPPPGPVSYRWELAPDGAFVGAKGGEDVMIDVGQTAIKVFDGGRRVLPRDTSSLPVRSPEAPDRDVEEQRRRARRFLAEALSPVRDRRRFVIALPCEVDDACAPGRCSYIGWEGDVDLLPDALRCAEVRADAEVLVTSDAELAALSCPYLGRKTLVVTVGYSIGAALKLA